ncbi:acyl-CoA dehydrogenase family protein [Kitasatospora kifunensis]|uniref:Alkylation response protein AidB-like acyl-CoA dehydrogenase n=1 Tax=Kitasatospora kifunensis TaxID=58351 RepID=A0A7W7VTM7_KITKI|nr:acyl-CoA dehydrogenase family protein [Kitasatospora kifunensis]MBB4921779.1 alkylation response protein AidB-like acyl-CoA dehydrogenase [Kitasatospora kifunensis]
MNTRSDRSPADRPFAARSSVDRSSADRSSAGEQRTAMAEALAALPRVVDLLAARAEEHDRDATFPYQGIEAVHEAGLLTLTVGQRFGGQGGTLAETVRVLAELGRGDASVALVTACTLLLHAEQERSARWPAAAYRRLLTESRRGPALVNTLDAEPGRAQQLRARRDGNGWLLTGRWSGCTGAEALAWMVVRAETDEPQPRTGLFLVRGESPGVEVDPVWDQLGLRASAGHDVVFTEVEVPAEAALGLRPVQSETGPADSGAGPDPAAAARTAWRDLALAAVQLGVGRAARDWLVRFLNQRTPANLAEPLGTLPRYQVALGEVESALIGAEELVAGLAVRIDAGEAGALERTGSAQLLVTRAVVDAVQRAVALTGSPGLSRRHPLERYLRDALSARQHGRCEDAVLAQAGRATLARATRSRGA